MDTAMKIKPGFKFVDGDLDIIRIVHELRLATIDHVAMLTGRSYKRTAARLAKLEEEAYLKCVTKRPHRHVYGIGKEGVQLLIHHGYATRELNERRLRDHELKDLGIKHALFITDIHAKLIAFTRASPFVLSRWVEGSTLWDRVTMSDNVTLPIRPDALFAITWPDGKGRANFFLEADRGSMAHSRMREKVSAYTHYFQKQLHVKKYPGMKTFRVATITETRGRANSLTEEFRTILSASWLAAYPTIAFEELSLERLMPEILVAQSA